MALTPGGLPYPVGTDKVVDGDDAIKALALAQEDFNTPRIGTGTSGALSGAETNIITLALTAGKWGFLLTGMTDWSVTGIARYFFNLRAPDNSSFAAWTQSLPLTDGAVPVVMQVSRITLATAGNVRFTAYQTGVTGGAATLPSVTLTARKVV